MTPQKFAQYKKKKASTENHVITTPKMMVISVDQNNPDLTFNCPPDVKSVKANPKTQMVVKITNVFIL